MSEAITYRHEVPPDEIRGPKQLSIQEVDRIWDAASEAAARAGSSTVELRHVLVAMVQVPGTHVHDVLAKLGATEPVRPEGVPATNGGRMTRVEPSVTVDAALEDSRRQAENAGEPWDGLLLLRSLYNDAEEETVSALEALGVAPDALRTYMDLDELPDAPPVAEAGTPPAAVVAGALVELSAPRPWTSVGRVEYLEALAADVARAEPVVTVLLATGDERPDEVFEALASLAKEGRVDYRLARMAFVIIGSHALWAARGNDETKALDAIATRLLSHPAVAYVSDVGVAASLAAHLRMQMLKHGVGVGEVTSRIVTTVEGAAELAKTYGRLSRIGDVGVRPSPTMDPDRVADHLAARLPDEVWRTQGVVIAPALIPRIAAIARLLDAPAEPTRCLRLIEDACAVAVSRCRGDDARPHELTASDVFRALGWRGVTVPPFMVRGVDPTAMRAALCERIFGQDEAIDTIVRAVAAASAGLRSKDRPLASMLLLGQTGVGKTELALAIAEHLFGDERAVIKFDMTKFAEPYTASNLVGSAKGLVGYEGGGELTEAVRRRPYAVLLIDEFDRAQEGSCELPNSPSRVGVRCARWWR